MVCTGVCNVHFRTNDILRVPGGESVNFKERSSPSKKRSYTGFPKYAVSDLLEPGMNGENVKLVSVPIAYTGRGHR